MSHLKSEFDALQQEVISSPFENHTLHKQITVKLPDYVLSCSV